MRFSGWLIGKEVPLSVTADEVARLTPKDGRLAVQALYQQAVDVYGVERVTSQADAVVEMVENADIEQVGMKVTMDYERAQGRIPEDVAAENLGFDVRSTNPEMGRKYYIEVKARAQVGPVAMTQNEWFKASRFGSEFYLYVVLDAATQPQLYIIQDPAANLQPQERVEVRYLVGVGDITGKGERV